MCNGQSEYPLYIKGLIMREQGRIEESLTIFQAALCLNPTNINNLKQVGKSLYLLGKHREAMDVLEEAQNIDTEDRMVWHSKGMCHKFIQEFEEALECFETANTIQKHDATFKEIGEIHIAMGNKDEALNSFLDALDSSPQNSTFLTLVGILYLEMKDTNVAFENLGNSLTYKNTDPKSILAAGSIIQSNGDYDVALTKYRVAMSQTPHNAPLWNNVGLCLYGKSKLIAATACLKRAIYLAPFDGRIHYNLGIVHLALEQYASAFYYFSAAINLQKMPNTHPTIEDARCYTYLGVALSRLDDYENSCAAYEKAVELYPKDPVTRLNYAITLFLNENDDKAREQLEKYESFADTDEGKELINGDTDLDEQYELLKEFV
jgi:Bardet-Biedl syndrome 4 protein